MILVETKLIVRFRNDDDLKVLGDKLGLELTNKVKEVRIPSNEIKYKREIKKPKEAIKYYWEDFWFNMPKFDINFKKDEYARIDFYIDDMDLEYVKDLFEQNITDKTTSIWYPKLVHGLHRNIRVLGGRNPKYPIYVVSKGRYTVRRASTSFRLSEMNVPHYLVVEPQEYELYKDNFENEYTTILKMDMQYKEGYDCFSNLGNKDSTGPGAVRNFCWEHSIKNGYDYHWVMDDNLDGFDRFYDGKRIMVMTGEAFRTCEEYVERFENIAISGLNYSKFCKDGDRVPPFVLNTRIYSCLLIRNDIPYRWRGRYNEDTDLSLRVLKDGWCTIQFNLFLCAKLTTQRISGGNTDEFYSKEGTKPKSQMLVDMHPDVTKLVWKFNRWHHQVDYSGFTQELKLKKGIKKDFRVNENGMYLVRVPREELNHDIDNRAYLESHYNSEAYYVTKPTKVLKPTTKLKRKTLPKKLPKKKLPKRG